MGPQRRAVLAVLLLTVLCGAHTAQALDLKRTLKNVFKKRGQQLADMAANGVDGLSNVVANWLEEEGATEAAAVVRSASDTVEASLRAAVDGSACAGHVSTGARIVGTAGCLAGAGGCLFGGLIGGALGGAVSPACHRTAQEMMDALDGAADTIDAVDAALDNNPPATSTYMAQCSGKSFATDDASDCAITCGEQAPNCAEVSWYFDAGCCLCKYYQYECEGGSDTSGGTPSAPSSQRPASGGGSDGSGGSCGSIEYDTDYFGADIVPVTSKWADTAVAAASPEDCCEACSVYSYCEAWTFTAAEHCKERFPNAAGCCFLKKGSGYEKRSASGMVSGTNGGRPAAACTLEFDTDLFGGDLKTKSGADRVVATISDADCCQSCAATPGCGAWTMAPPSECSDRLPHARGCCFLKHEGGWTRTKDDKGVLTSGQLLG